jgi:tyrosyl-tRNA synthetase
MSEPWLQPNELLLYREYAKDKKMRFSPIIISHHMLMGLKEGQEKMSKSDPDSAIFMEDSVADVSLSLCKSLDYSLL